MPCLKSFVHRKYAHKKMTFLALAICLSLSSGSAFADTTYTQVQIVKSATGGSNIATDDSTTVTNQFQDSSGTVMGANLYVISIGTLSNVNISNSVSVGGQAVALGDANQDLGNTAFGDYASANTYKVTTSGVTGDNGGYATAIGYHSSATNDGTVAVGALANADGAGSVATGYKADAAGKYSIAIGYTASSSNESNIAIGNAAKASGAGSLGTTAPSIAIGNSAEATAANTLSIGSSAKANYDNDTALGTSAVASNVDATAVGYNAQASEEDTTAVGDTASASGKGATSLGFTAAASAEGSTAIGMNSVANKQYSVAVGNAANATGDNAIAVGGSYTVASGNLSIAIGTNVTASALYAISIGSGSTAAGEGSTVLGTDAIASGKYSTAIGYNANTNKGDTGYENATAVGKGTLAQTQSVALGSGATANETNTMALGYGARTDYVNSIALGSGAAANKADSIALGTGATTNNVNSIALGNGSAANNDNSVAIGTNSVTSAANTADTEKKITIVSSSGVSSTFTYAGLASNDMGTVSVGGTVNNVTTVRQIQNVAAGDITATSTDAVNGSQLYATNANVANLTDRVAAMSGGGGSTTTIGYVKSHEPAAAVDASAGGANSSALGYNSNAAGDNSTAVGNGSSAATTGATALGEGAKASTSNSVALGTASTTGTVNTGKATDTGTTATTAKITAADGTTSTFTYAGPASADKGLVSVGSAGAERQIQNVAAGDIAEKSTDAVNGSQLYATNENVSNLQTEVAEGITFAGNTGSDKVALGKTVKIEGTGTTAGTYSGANIKTAETIDTSGNSTIEIMMTDTPVFTSVTAGTFTTSGKYALTISGETGYITNLENKTWVAGSYTSGRAATEDQLNAVQSQVTNIKTGTGIDYVKSDKPENAAAADDSGTNSSALGYNSKATGTNATAVGNSSYASKEGATALGEGAQATTANSVALGTASTTSAVNTGTKTDTGTTATTTTITDKDGKTKSTFTYAGTASDTNGTVSVGKAGAERQIQNVAAGDVAEKSTDAVNGSQLYATNINVSNLQAEVANGITFAGNTSTTAGGDAVALGKTVTIKGTGKTVGTTTIYNIETAEAYDTTTGNSTIEIMMSDTPIFTSVTAGTFTAKDGNNKITISGSSGTINGLTNTTWDATKVVSGQAATEDQLNAVQTQITNIKTGTGIAYVKSDNSKTTDAAVIKGADSSALGYGSQATASQTTAVGNKSEASAANATAVGEGAQAKGIDSTAVGTGAQATVTNATALGDGAKATTANSVALGTASTTSDAHTGDTANKATVYDINGNQTTTDYEGQASDANGTVSVGSAGKERQIQNVAAGDVTAKSTDAVNGSQLYATNTNVVNLDTRMSSAEKSILDLKSEVGGDITFAGNTGSKEVGLNTTFNIKGEGTKEDSEYSGSNIKTVVDGNTLTIKMDENPSFTSVTATSIIAGSGSTQVLINNTGISVGGNTYISSTGINANNQVITNVAAGSATAGSTDAVNGTQLYETNQAVAKNAQDIANINNGYNILDNKIDKVGAGAAALAGLHPLEFDPTDRFSMSTGVGTYRGEHALAMGAFYRPTESTMYSVGSELGNSNNMWTVGVSFKFGADKTNPASRSNIVRELLQLKAENKAIKADNLAMKAELNEIKQQLAQLVQKK